MKLYLKTAQDYLLDQIATQIWLNVNSKTIRQYWLTKKKWNFYWLEEYIKLIHWTMNINETNIFDWKLL